MHKGSIRRPNWTSIATYFNIPGSSENIVIVYQFCLTTRFPPMLNRANPTFFFSRLESTPRDRFWHRCLDLLIFLFAVHSDTFCYFFNFRFLRLKEIGNHCAITWIRPCKRLILLTWWQNFFFVWVWEIQVAVINQVFKTKGRVPPWYGSPANFSWHVVLKV